MANSRKSRITVGLRNWLIKPVLKASYRSVQVQTSRVFNKISVTIQNASTLSVYITHVAHIREHKILTQNTVIIEQGEYRGLHHTPAMAVRQSVNRLQNVQSLLTLEK